MLKTFYLFFYYFLQNQIITINYKKITKITVEREASKKRADTIRGMLLSKLKYINIYNIEKRYVKNIK